MDFNENRNDSANIWAAMDKTETPEHREFVYIDMPMKWHNFLIYFSLWASAVINTIGGLSMLSGLHYQGWADNGLRALELLMALSSLGIAAFTVVTRFALANRQSKGPKLLTALYAINIALSLLYPLLASVVTGMPLSELTDFSTFTGIITSVVFLFVNMAYYNNRAHIFVN